MGNKPAGGKQTNKAAAVPTTQNAAPAAQPAAPAAPVEQDKSQKHEKYNSTLRVPHNPEDLALSRGMTPHTLAKREDNGRALAHFRNLSFFSLPLGWVAYLGPFSQLVTIGQYEQHYQGWLSLAENGRIKKQSFVDKMVASGVDKEMAEILFDTYDSDGSGYVFLGDISLNAVIQNPFHQIHEFLNCFSIYPLGWQFFLVYLTKFEFSFVVMLMWMSSWAWLPSP